MLYKQFASAHAGEKLSPPAQRFRQSLHVDLSPTEVLFRFVFQESAIIMSCIPHAMLQIQLPLSCAIQLVTRLEVSASIMLRQNGNCVTLPDVIRSKVHRSILYLPLDQVCAAKGKSRMRQGYSSNVMPPVSEVQVSHCLQMSLRLWHA
jgi:hypothetical protein